MPIDTGEVMQSAAGYIDSFAVVNRVVRNPLWLALAISILMIIIVIFIFRKVESSESVAKMAFRAAFYLFICSSILIFLNNKDLKHDYEYGNYGDTTKKLFAGVDKVGAGIIGVAESDIVPINIKTPNWT